MRYILIVICLLFFTHTFAQDSLAFSNLEATVPEEILDSLNESNLNTELALQTDSTKAKKKGFISRVMDGFSNFFMGCDTNYVTPQKYQFTTQLELSYWHDFYHIRSSKTNNAMTIESDPSMVVGGYVYYSIIGYGMAWNVNEFGKPSGRHSVTSRRSSLSIHTAKIFAEMYTFNSGKTAKITHLSNYDLTGKDNNFLGLSSKCTGILAFYIFNNKHFSWPAAFGFNAVQRKSCGTLNLGFSYNHQTVNFDENELPAHLLDYVQNVDTTLLFNKVNYDDYSISIGYAYNWVLGRNVLFAVSAQPSIGYRRSNIVEADNQHDILNNISTDLNFRACITWNNTRFFSGLMLDLHTYSYRQKKFGLTNTYGTLKYVLGLNFLKKPEYKKKK